MKILIIEDKKSYLELIQDILDSEGIDSEGVLTGKEGLAKIKEERYSLIISDLFLPDLDGFEIIKKTKKIYPEIPIIMITAFSSVERAVEAIKLGAYDFIPKPFEPEHLILKVRKAYEETRLKTENIIYRAQKGETVIIGESKIIKDALNKLEKVALTDASVLLQGESGTGKELFARRLHELSNRHDYPFVSINCAAIPEKLLETELFGYEKGAFTGAYKTKQGKFELAHQGTVFLDEIGDLPLELQPKLLKVIEEKSFERVGGVQKINSDLRFVFATNKDLKTEVKGGNFREDLYFRISVFPIYIPPLRDRKEDIPLLIDYFLEKISRKIKKKIIKINKSARDKIINYGWYGNIRELQNTIERAIILSKDGVIKEEDILLEKEEDKIDISGSLKEAVEKIEKIKIKKALDYYKDKKTAADSLGITYKTLQIKIKKYNIEL